MDLLFVCASTFFIMHHSPSMKSRTACLDSPRLLVTAECTCHVWVLWRWWWLYGAPGALVCISWQMGGSAPLLFPVMMSHVPVYQRGHTQLSLHLLLSQPPSFFPLSLSLKYRLELWLSRFVPLTSILPREPVHIYLQTQLLYMCLHVERFGCVTALYGALKGKARAAPTTWSAALIIACSWCIVPIAVSQGKWQSLCSCATQMVDLIEVVQRRHLWTFCWIKYDILVLILQPTS